MVKRVLMIAFHYPPMQGSSGIQRTLKFAQYLPSWDWEALVLTASPGAYDAVSSGQADDIAPQAIVHRSLALDAARHLALRGRYPALLAQPDRWTSWWLSAVPAGLRLIRRHKPQLIWSSYPIATAHLIALALHRLTGIPWVADQRDPLIDGDYPPEPRRHSIHRWIETQMMRRCAAIVCTTPSAARELRRRYPQMPPDRVVLIANGYDERNFADAADRAADGAGNGDLSCDREGDRNCDQASDQASGHAGDLPPAPAAQNTARPFRLLHSGLVYPSERDPAPLLRALAALRRDGAINPTTFRLVLRASGHDTHLLALLREYDVAELVELAPPLPYRAALAEMLAADGLLLLQAANCNGQIPAKLYEYLRARRPLLALTDPAGDTAAALREAGIDTIADLASADAIAEALPRFLALCRAARAPLASDAVIAGHARSARARELAHLFDHILSKEAP